MDFVKILTLRNEVESHLMDQALTEQGIPHRMRSYHDSAYDGLYQALKGWGHIEAPSECKGEILAIYKEMTAARGPDQDCS
jgi:hypothetical protein